MRITRAAAAHLLLALWVVGVASTAPALAADPAVNVDSEAIDAFKGITAVVGLPVPGRAGSVVGLAKSGDRLVYFQSASAEEVAAVRKAAEDAGVLGTTLFIDQGELASIHLADNLADTVLVSDRVQNDVNKQEILRVLSPGGSATLGSRDVFKPIPEGLDDWAHPYHGPDNNPQSTDQRARAPYLTQFLAKPLFCPMPEVTVAAGGKVYRAFGHIAHKANQNAMLNTLICVNGHNGAILWKRPLKEGFMIHRNTMIATPEALYLADDESCKRIDARTGEVNDEIVVSQDAPVWKWMALEDGVLYALVGGPETKVTTQRSNVPGLGHWPWGMWEGHEYADPNTSFGFSRTLVAVDPETKKVLWKHREDEHLDSRGVCMTGGRIYFYCPGKYLGCLDAKTGKPVWKNDDADLLEAIGPQGRAQHYVTGYATQTYIKCNDRYLFFAGPQRSKLVVASAKDGKLLWQKEHGNYQLVLRDDALYAAGPQNQEFGFKLAYETGEELGRFPRRRACTRATGSVDSIFFRASGGTVRVDTATNTAKHIALMRPPCQDGVIISSGHLYWGPWMCGCQLSLYGHVCLAPAGRFDFQPGIDDSRFSSGEGDAASVEPLDARPGDWPTLGGDNARSCSTEVSVARSVKRQWRFKSAGRPTAPVTAGGLVFLGDQSGAVRALDADGKEQWKAYTSGAIFFPPAVARGRVFVGSADGRVYAFEAATGRKLWSFRVGPAERWIPVYGNLISTWPVAGGVVVQDGTVYAAAGIAHYDGTHVVALDAITGKVRWYNDSSGAISEEVDSGVSLQGSLCVRGGELCFLGGGIYETARYDMKTGRCLNEPYEDVNSRFHTAFYPYFPEYGQYVSLDHSLADGKSLVYDAAYEGSRHSKLALLPPLPPGTPRPHKPASRWGRQGKAAQKPLWQEPSGRRFNGFVVGPDVVLTAGQTSPGGAQTAFLAAVDLQNGSDVWRRDLPAAVVKGGAAVDRDGRIIVCLEDGQVLCFAADGS
ncbi:MAG: outer membrane protein assembly factor BamB family protein [Planctomycetota bacterium]|jgi:outer membrane protein assembly factor BamB